jgi:hypothetical protein
VVNTRVANGPLLVLRSWRAKTIETCSGRPMPMLSATSASKKLRARRGSSKTKLRLISAWRIDSCHQ